MFSARRSLFCWLGAFACAHPQHGTPPASPPPIEIGTERAALVLPPGLKDRDGWAEDIVVAIRLAKKVPTLERVCAIAAVIEQESGFRANPEVRDLPRIVREGLRQKLSPLGPLAGPALEALLAGRAREGGPTFGERVERLRTERDLDLLFRDMEAAYRDKAPGPFAIAEALSRLLGKGGFEDMNPVTTAGSMQVKVRFAREVGGEEGLSDAEVRELLYTRGGGVHFGALRLIGYAAAYDDVIYRFADYNAGPYSSRNAAFQAQVGALTKRTLALDGDLLTYDADGKPKDVETESLRAILELARTLGISERAARRDVEREKTQGFEETKLWSAARAAWEAASGKPAAYARVPEVTLRSPKLTRERTTAWFAASVKRRYEACRARDLARVAQEKNE